MLQAYKNAAAADDDNYFNENDDKNSEDDKEKCDNIMSYKMSSDQYNN